MGNFSVVDNDTLDMTYKSERRMAALAEGLIEKSIAHYQESYLVQSVKIDEEDSIVKFIVSKSVNE